MGRHRANGERSLHLIDLENLLCGHVTPDRVNTVWAEYVSAVGIERDDHLVVGVAKRNAVTAAFALPRRIRCVFGEDVKNGADTALVDHLDLDHAVARYDKLVVGSGDDYFTPLPQAFRHAGRHTALVIGPAKVAAALYRACAQSIYLPSASVRFAGRAPYPMGTAA